MHKSKALGYKRRSTAPCNRVRPARRTRQGGFGSVEYLLITGITVAALLMPFSVGGGAPKNVIQHLLGAVQEQHQAYLYAASMPVRPHPEGWSGDGPSNSNTGGIFGGGNGGLDDSSYLDTAHDGSDDSPYFDTGNGASGENSNSGAASHLTSDHDQADTQQADVEQQPSAADHPVATPKQAADSACEGASSNAVLAFLGGLWEGIKSQAAGLWHLITNPIDSGQNLYKLAEAMVTDPEATLAAIAEVIGKDISHLVSGSPCQRGVVIGQYVSPAVAAKVVAKLARFSDLPKVIDSDSDDADEEQPNESGDPVPDSGGRKDRKQEDERAPVPISLDEAIEGLRNSTGDEAESYARQIARMSTHVNPENPNRVVLGQWKENGGYIAEAKDNGGVWFETDPTFFSKLSEGLSDSETRKKAWLVNKKFLQSQMESGIEKIVLYGETIPEVIANRPNSFTAKEIKFLHQNAQKYGYERDGNVWIKVR